MLMDWLVGTFGSDGAYGITVAADEFLKFLDLLFELFFS